MFGEQLGRWIALLALARDQLASRQVVAGSSRSSAPSCNRTGSRSPSIAVRNTERASSSGFPSRIAGARVRAARHASDLRFPPDRDIPL
jgi:hypothetical protein